MHVGIATNKKTSYYHVHALFAGRMRAGYMNNTTTTAGSSRCLISSRGTCD